MAGRLTRPTERRTDMIPDDHLHLLTAAVDGELTPDETARLRALLSASADARVTFERLRADRDRLRNLPTPPAPADLRARVMARIPHPAPTTHPAPPRRPIPARPGRTPSRGPLAVAASLLLAVAGGSFWYFVRQDDTGLGNHRHTASHNPSQLADPARPTPNDTDPPDGPVDANPLPAPGDGGKPPVLAANGPSGDAIPQTPEEAPLPRPVVRDVLTFPPLPELPPLDLVRVRVPFLATAADFSRDDVRQDFVDELGRDPAFRIDLFAKDPTRGAELFQAAARAAGTTLFADALTLERIKRKQPAAYLVYAESLTPAELRDLFTHLAAVDRKNPQPVFDTVHAVPANQTDLKDLKDVLGTDPGLWKRAAAAPTPTPTEPKAISSGTGDMVAKSLTTPPAKPGDKPALLATFGPASVRTHPSASREVKQFLDKRGERKPNVVPVLIVIRQANG